MLLSRTICSAGHQVTFFRSSSELPDDPHNLQLHIGWCAAVEGLANSCVWLRGSWDQSLFEVAEDCGSTCYGMYATPYSYSCSLMLFDIHQMLDSVCTIMWPKGGSGSVRVIVVSDHCVLGNASLAHSPGYWSECVGSHRGCTRMAAAESFTE